MENTKEMQDLFFEWFKEKINSYFDCKTVYTYYGKDLEMKIEVSKSPYSFTPTVFYEILHGRDIFGNLNLVETNFCKNVRVGKRICRNYLTKTWIGGK